MKPRLFVGSSTESINIALAVQYNLRKDVEATVWNQGIFDLSATNLDSLLKALGNSDFGVFVFSPDDVARIRGAESLVVRDNVIFELGLFVGRLGKKRCYIIVPEDTNALHLPTDLLGVTPAVYDSNRNDGNLQAATAPACFDIRKSIMDAGVLLEVNQAPEKLPKASSKVEDSLQRVEEVKASEQAEEASSTNQVEDQKRSEKRSWILAFFDDDYKEAIELLEYEITQATAEHMRVFYRVWIGRAKARLNFKDGIAYIEKLISESPDDAMLYQALAEEFGENDLYEDCFAVIERGLSAAKNPQTLIVTKANFLHATGKTPDAISLLNETLCSHPEYEGFYMTLATLYTGAGDLKSAESVLKKGLAYFPNDADLLLQYGSLKYDAGEIGLALFVYGKLVGKSPNDARFLTNYGNACLLADLSSLALSAYEKANILANEKQGWILGNIGNIYKNKGFYLKAIEFLKRAITLDPDSLYILEQLSTSMKHQEEEEKKLNELLTSAKKEFYSKDDKEEDVVSLDADSVE